MNLFNSQNNKRKENSKKIQKYINRYKLNAHDLSNEEYVKSLDSKEQSATIGFQGYSWLDNALVTSGNRKSRYKEYNQMCSVPELNLGVNIYADNATQYDAAKNVLKVLSKNQKIIEDLNDLFFNRLNINANLWSYAHNLCKFGDEFLEIILDDKSKNILSLERIKKPENFFRKEKNNRLEGFVYTYDRNTTYGRSYGNTTYGRSGENSDKVETFEPWQIVHFRIDNDEFDPYGKSILESGRRTFKRLTLMEDAMLIYRISRAPERRVFYIDVGTLSTKDSNYYIEQLKRKFKKKTFVNPRTGEINEKANPMSVDEDFFIPVRQDSQGTRIETLPPGANLGEIDDIKYFKNMILKTLGIPSGYLGSQTEGVTYDPKSYLSNQEIQFSRTIERVQKFIINGLEKIAIIELILHGYNSEDLKNFQISLTPPSNVDQLVDIEIMNNQFSLIQSIKGIIGSDGIPFLPDSWIYKNVLGLSESEISNIKLQNQIQMQMQDMVKNNNADNMGIQNNFNSSPMEAGGPDINSEPVNTSAGENQAETNDNSPELQVASQKINFDGGQLLLENEKDLKKLLNYVYLYDKNHKDNERTNIIRKNGQKRMEIKGEFMGINSKLLRD